MQKKLCNYLKIAGQLLQEKPAEEEEDEEKGQEEEKESVKAPPAPPEKGKEKDKKDAKPTKESKAAEEKKQEKEKPKEPERPSGMIGKPEDDLTLRAAMYGVLFQSYADQVSLSWSCHSKLILYCGML